MLKALRPSPQQPIKRAIPQDERCVRRWRGEVWPELKRRAHRERRVLVF
jgi:transposase-like protein